MPFKFSSKTNILLLFLLLFTMLPLTVFAQDGTQTFTTTDGLSFDYPENWQVQSIGGLTFVTSNDITLLADELGMGDVLVSVMDGDTLASEYGDFDDLDAAMEDLSDSLSSASDSPDVESITLNGHSGFRFDMTDEFGHGVLVVLDIDGQLVGLVGATNADDFANQEATILAIAESMRYDGAEPTEIEGFDFGDFDDVNGPASDAATVGNEIIVWQQQSPVSEDIFSDFGSYATLSVNGDSITVSDGFNIAQINSDGTLNNVVMSPQFSFINAIALDADGSLWASTYGDDMLIHLNPDLTLIDGWNNDDFDTPIFGDFLGVQEIAFSPDGDLYMFTGHYDEEFNTNGTILVWSDGVFDREFSVQEEDEFGGSAYSYDAQIAFTPDGNIFLIDSGGNMKVVDPQGNVVRDDFIDGYELGIYGVNDVAIAPDGTIIIATLEGITRLSPDGIVIDTFGTTQGVGLEDAPEFESGQFSSTGPQALAVLSDGSLIAISSNGTYNLVIRLDYSAAE